MMGMGRKENRTAGCRFWTYGKSLFGRRIPREEFMEKSVSINRIIFRVGAVFGVLVELMNMLRVLLFTNVKLGTVNNRIYFGFYLTYFLLCGALLVIDCRGRLSLKAENRLYLYAAGFFLCWHVTFNLYDVYRGGAVGYFTVVTVIFFFSGFLMFRPSFTLICLGLSYAAFVLGLKFLYSSGEILNFTVTVFLCALMYLVRYHHLGIEIAQAGQLRTTRRELTSVRRDFRLTVEQYALIWKHEKTITFEWNLRDDWIRFSREWTYYFDQPEYIAHFHQYITECRKLTPQHKETLFSCMDKIRRGVAYQKYELILPVNTGEERWFEMCVITQTDDQDAPFFGIGTLSDITDRKKELNQLETETKMDLFTGLLNKASVERFGESMLADLRNGEILASLMLDMDDFKNVNDRYGHPVGDFVLKEVAQILRQYAPDRARIGRIGGDEFIVLLTTDNWRVFVSYAETLLEQVPKISWKGKDTSLQCSIGLAASHFAGEPYAELYRRTDEALYEAKRRGKGTLYSSCSFPS